MKGLFMVNMVASKGVEFASETVAVGSVLYVDGSDAEVPFFWVMGPEFGFRVVREGECPNCGGAAWTATFSNRTFNGAGSEFVMVDESTQHADTDAGANLLAPAFMLQYLEVADGGLLALARGLASEMGINLPSDDLVEWVREVAPALVDYSAGDMLAYQAAQEAQRFDVVRLDEIV
jgi:hypothetical protein